MSSRYVVVSTDPNNTTIISGPNLWGSDDLSGVPVQSGQAGMLEADALANGFTYYDPPPDPSQLMTWALQTALDTNIAYLANVTPGAADKETHLAALTRQMNAMIRLYIGMTDTTDGT